MADLGIHGAARRRRPMRRVLIVLGIAFVSVATIAATLDQGYCAIPELRFGGIGWLLAMAPVVLLGALMAAAFVTSITPDALGLAAWVAVMVIVPLAAAAGDALGLMRLECEVGSLDGIIGMAAFASVPAAGVGGVIGWVVGVRRGR